MKTNQQLDKLNNVNKIEAKSLRCIDPGLSKQWNFKRNADVTPDNEMIDEENWNVRWWICGRSLLEADFMIKLCVHTVQIRKFAKTTH